MDAFWLGTTVGLGIILFRAARKNAERDLSAYARGSAANALGDGGALAGTAGTGVPVISACTDGCACSGIADAANIRKNLNPMRPSAWSETSAAPASPTYVNIFAQRVGYDPSNL